jgi:hypothetical protein
MSGSEVTDQQLVAARATPIGWIQHILGAKLWDKQKEICRSVVKNRATLVKSANGTGKTHIAARIALWWLFTRPRSTVVTTATSFRQVERLLWKEIRTAHTGALEPLGGNFAPKAPRLEIQPDWAAYGFSTDDPVNFQGFHSFGGNLFIIDEAAGIRDENVWSAIEGSLVGDEDRLLALANPTEPSGTFYEKCRKGDGHVITVSAFDVPNVKEGKTIIPGLVTKEWVEKQRREWGEGAPAWQARVLGQFPESADSSIVPLSWVDQAIERWQKLEEKNDWKLVDTLAADVARMGSDSTVVAEGNRTQGIREMHYLPKADLMSTTGALMRLVNDRKDVILRVDADGIGAGVADRAMELLGERRVAEIRGGMVDHRVQYDLNGNPLCLNNRAEWYWNARRRLDPFGENPIALPPDDRLRAALTSVRYKMTSRGLIQVESKDDMRSRGMPSPDEADAIVYCLADLDHGFDIFGHLEAMCRI